MNSRFPGEGSRPAQLQYPSVEGGGQLQASNGPFGIQITDNSPQWVWIKITGNNLNTNAYSWELLQTSDQPNFAATLVSSLGASGSFTSRPAYEVNQQGRAGSTPVPTGTNVQAYPANNYLIFSFSQPASSGGGVGDVIGPDAALTGQLAVFTDPNGRIIGPTRCLSYDEYSQNEYYTSTIHQLSLSADPIGRAGNAQTGYPHTGYYVATQRAEAGQFTGTATTFSTATAETVVSTTTAGAEFWTGSFGAVDTVQEFVFIDKAGHILGSTWSITCGNYAYSGRWEFSPDTINGTGRIKMQNSTGIHLWSDYYTINGVPGLTAFKTFTDNVGVTHTVQITGGIITSWTP